MLKVRRNVFESNSSSTHSITIATAEEYDNWKNGKLLFDRWNQVFVEGEKQCVKEEDVREFYEDNKSKYYKDWTQLSDNEKQEWYNKYKEEHDMYKDIMTFEEYMNYYNEELETYNKRFTTPSNDEMVAFGYYGYN